MEIVIEFTFPDWPDDLCACRRLVVEVSVNTVVVS